MARLLFFESNDQDTVHLLRLVVRGRIDERGGRLDRTTPLASVLTCSTPHATLSIDLRMTGGGEYHDTNPQEEDAAVIRIPAQAIVCETLATGERIQCEGGYDCVRRMLRIDAVDQERYAWLWMTVETMCV
jgi:hypothetical protein